MLTISDRARWHKLKSILADALEQPSSQRRDETLRQACTDDVQLLQEAEALLNQDTTALEHFAEFAAICMRDDLPSRVGERVGAYAITREIGRGGMGAVYLARRADGQFEKQVAIKILKRGTDTEEVLRRFRAERQILANLEHSHITRLIDAGITTDNLPYVVMEFVDGRPITKFVQDERCDLRQRLVMFLKVCSAVELAHKQGVIHRDIKPSNILVKDDGEVKLLDFGIAKVVAGDCEDVTVALERRLTPKYAAPEQSTGRPSTSATDIYSLGVLLSDLLNDLPQHQTSDESMLSCLRNVAERATKGEPAGRYPSAAALADSAQECLAGKLSPSRLPTWKRGGTWLTAALVLASLVIGALFWLPRASLFRRAAHGNTESPAPSSPSGTIHSIAILPFNPLDRDKDELLGLGMADAIIGRLSGLKQLVVLPTAAVSRFQGQSEDAISAGKKLNVDAVLSGTVQRVPDRIRVTIQLINIASRQTLWAETFDQTWTDVFALQDSISEKVAGSLLANLSEADRQQLEKHFTGDTTAYESYLLGVSAYNLRTKEGLQKAIGYFDKAVSSDPHYALAYALTSDCYFLQYYYRFEPSATVLPKAKSAAEKALALDSSLPEAHLAISTIQRMATGLSPDSPGVQSLLRAIRLNPNFALAHQRYAWFLSDIGELEHAVQEMTKAQALDPLSSTNNTGLGILLLLAHRYVDGFYYCETAAELNPMEPFIQGNLGDAYLLNGKYDEAIRHYRKAEELDPTRHADTLAQVGTALARAGRTQELENLMPEILQLAREKEIDPYSMALLYTARGNYDNAINWLVQTKGVLVTQPGLLRYDPQLDPIRSDARFQEFLKKAELEMPRR